MSTTTSPFLFLRMTFLRGLGAAVSLSTLSHHSDRGSSSSAPSLEANTVRRRRRVVIVIIVRVVVLMMVM